MKEKTQTHTEGSESWVDGDRNQGDGHISLGMPRIADNYQKQGKRKEDSSLEVSKHGPIDTLVSDGKPVFRIVKE